MFIRISNLWVFSFVAIGPFFFSVVMAETVEATENSKIAIENEDAFFVEDASVGHESEIKNEVRDLYYGNVLYDFYQQNYYSSAVGLLTAQKQNRLSHHGDDGELLLAGMYLSYGLHTDAEEIFQRLIEKGAKPEVRDRAWFFLGKIRYYKHLFRESEEALNRVGDSLDESLQAEYRTLKSNLLMAQEKYDEAVVALAAMKQERAGENLDAYYVQFNLGVALIRAGREKEGVSYLKRVAKLQSNQTDLKALRDKANLALGYSLLKRTPVLAKEFLTKVRLHGPFSNRALLGLGWAEVELEQYEQALLPWAELNTREKDDLAVFESLLATGNVLERLRAFPPGYAIIPECNCSI